MNISKQKVLLIFICLIFVISSCGNRKDTLTEKQITVIKNNIQELLDSIALNISGQGPTAWLYYFEDIPNFFMASDGQLSFQDKETAKSFTYNTLVKQIKKIQLNWNNIRIDALSGTLAGIGADFHEDITNVTGNNLPFDGYFTALVHKSSHGWKLRNLHWSIKK